MARSSTTSGSNCRHRPARGLGAALSMRTSDRRLLMWIGVLISIIAVSYATGEVAALSSRG